MNANENANENAKNNHTSHTSKGTSGKARQDIFEDTAASVEGVAKKNYVPISDEAGKMRPEKLKYMADMLVELRKIAENLDEKMVSYLIEMAILELHTVRSLSNTSGEVSDKKTT